MKIKCIAPWAGGKRRLAKRIVELLGPHDTYVEPFVGGCSILPVKPRSLNEFINDKNTAIASVLRVLSRPSDSTPLRFAMNTKTFCKEVYDKALANLKQFEKPVAASNFAYAQLVAWWMGPNGLAGTDRKGWFAKRHTKTGGCPAKRWESFKDSLIELCDRLYGVTVYSWGWRDISQMVSQEGYDVPQTAIYIDPPYFRKSFKYTVDFTKKDHRELAAWANSIKHARIVLSYDDAPELVELYPEAKWRRVRIEQSKNMAASLGRSKRNVEVLLINQP